MTDQQKRAEVMAMYPNSRNWTKRVSRMPDAQVFAIWAKNKQSETKDETEDEDDPDIPF